MTDFSKKTQTNKHFDSIIGDLQNSRIYIYLATTDIGKRFLQDAENEGFMFRDGVKPTQREADSIFAINDDMTINYVGFVGHVAYQAADKIGNKPLIKIDYRDILNRAE